jgi:hypothetical protein
LNEMTPSFYVIGRHSEATIRMPPDATLSLRHALVQVSWHQHQPRVQIMDLQTHQGFRVWEDGRPLHTHYITCTGHAAGTIGHCHWLLIANRSGAWPDKAEDAWDKWMKGQFEHSRSLAHLMNQSERIVGGLSINRETFFLSVRELASGVLLGRYSRCDIRREDDSMLSRVHAFLWMEAQTRRLWLVDAASTNGIQFHRDRASRPRRLPGSPHQEQAYLLDNRCKWSLGEQSMSWLYLPNHPLSGYMA